jgi:hypothetical protein
VPACEGQFDRQCKGQVGIGFDKHPGPANIAHFVALGVFSQRMQMDSCAIRTHTRIATPFGRKVALFAFAEGVHVYQSSVGVLFDHAMIRQFILRYLALVGSGLTS